MPNLAGPAVIAGAPGPAGHARILGIGGYRPIRIVGNDEICQAIDSTDAWIQERSGIVNRRFAGPQESVVDMAESAARQALDHAGIPAGLLDCVIVATITHPYQTPAAAAMLAGRLGVTAAAFDLGAACAGYCYAMSLANDLVRCGTATYVLVVGVEKLTDFTDFTDRGSAFIFADGAGAAIVGPAAAAGIGPAVWGSAGDQWQVIQQRVPWTELRDVDRPEWPNLVMAGQSVFRWAVWAMAPVAREAMTAAGVSPDDLAVFLPHQANMRIIDALAKQLKLPEHVHIARDIADAGNTSAASIPLAAKRLLDEGQARSGDLALQIGFGAGLAYAAQVVTLP